ncbi:MAG: hypothetical protein U0802_15435 [Candidatus Binatia bacterium]
MAFRVTSVVLGVAAVSALIGALLFGMRPEAQEPAAPADEVTPDELQLYIDVYSTMQADHDLTIETVLVQKNVTLQQFRSVERRVQQQERLVHKVREALTAQAKARAEQIAPMAARPPGTPAATPTGTP